jgi:hypothetical protein
VHVDGISFDLAKTFDCVNHELLLLKVNVYVIWNIAGQWFKSYLQYKKQQVEIKSSDSNNSASSNWDIIEHGVPQGSVLGPQLFLVCIHMICPNHQFWV